MKEYFFKHKLKFALGVLAFAVFIVAIPFAINWMFKFSAPSELFAAEWGAGDALGFYATMLGSVAAIAGVYLSIDAAQKSYHEDEINKVKPYFALTHYKTKSRFSLDIGINKQDDRQNEDDLRDCYKEYKLDRVYIVISSDGIKFKDQLERNQEELLQSAGLGWEVEKAKMSLRRYKFVSMPFDVENVGNGAALNSYVCFSKKGDQLRGLNVFTVKTGQSFYCHIFSDEQDDSILGEYVLRFNYEDVLGNRYSQKYDVKIDINEKTGDIKESIDLAGKQEKISK